jgi:hypothetical protein
MKKTIFLLLFTILLSCSKTNNNLLNMNQNRNINSKNIVEEVFKLVKRDENSPIYILNFNISYNFTEIYINDIKAYKNFNNETGGSSLIINQFLLDKENQQLKIKLYAASEKILSEQSGLDINIESYYIKDRFNNINEPNLFVYQTPKDKDGLFIGAGKTFYEDTVTFNLPNVPYTIDGWKESKDLKDFDKKDLEMSVLQAYKMIEKAFKEKDLDKIAQFSYNKIKDQAISQYFDKDEVQEGWDELASIAGADNLEFFPLEDYELVFYGDGKLVGLKSKKNEKGFRGASALLCKFKLDGKWTGAELDYLLHIPKGKTEFEVY